MCEPDVAPVAAAAYPEVTFGGRRTMRLQRLSSFGFSALALVLAAGCSGGQTGDLSGKGDRTDQKVGHEASGGCDEQRVEVDFDEQTEAGSAEELLSYAERTFDAPLTWKTAGQGQT